MRPTLTLSSSSHHRRGWVLASGRLASARVSLLQLAATVSACVAVAAVVHGGSAPTSGRSVVPGVYHGWVAQGESRFQLLGSACSEGDAVVAAQLAPPPGPTLWPRRTRLPGAAVLTREADLGLGRFLPVVEFAGPALPLLFAHPADNDPHRTAATPVRFGGLTVRCRSGREISANLGRAAVLPLPGDGSGPALEAHAWPVPDDTPVLALLLLWNRSEHDLVVDALSYAPRASATGEVLAVSGVFERFRELERAILSPRRLAASDEAVEAPLVGRLDADALDLHLAPGGVALLALDHESFDVEPDVEVFLSYPVVDYRHRGRAHTLGVLEPLFSERLTWHEARPGRGR